MINYHIDDWSLSENIWLKRTSILYQLRYKKETDKILLAKYIKRSLGTKELFINKAIGWALREHGKINPQYILDFVANEPSPSNLSRKETLRRIEIH